jgi:hypothetical protein
VVTQHQDLWGERDTGRHVGMGMGMGVKSQI